MFLAVHVIIDMNELLDNDVNKFNSSLVSSSNSHHGLGCSFELNVSSKPLPPVSNKVKATYESFDYNQDRPIGWFFDEVKKLQISRKSISYQGYSKMKSVRIDTVA